MLKIAVCDDDLAVVDTIITLLKDLEHEHSVKICVDTFSSGGSFIDSIKNKTIYDIVYLDIEIGELNGIDIAHLIRQQSVETLIVFVSSHDIYYKPAFEVQPFGFMDKPVDKKEFDMLFSKMHERIFSNDNLFQYNVNKVDKRVAYKDILYFESDKRQIVMHTVSGEDAFYGTISNLAKELKRKEFILLHQSFLVNYAYIAEFAYAEVKLLDGKIVVIAYNRRKAVRDEYMEIKRRRFANDIR